ncbi:MAG: Trk system potassium transporter TrkA [Candidatus Nitrohelix vancouverensis]|uniref:Trk system potassium uptake protein TrkA n=1 Tax=Candidatus Nitrohelix vancouverensis TaxID=2705534 RepID=A0A7T0C1R0_9BACT|nr:MAG: Trk system potassium transporter TrkA [Candidatus Nitrohelix vancouverensis]
MRILIIGAGIVGSNLARELSNEGHDIAIIDSDAERIRPLADTLDILTVQGNACLPSVMIRAGIQSMEMVISVTERDEVNLYACFLASRFNIKHRFARLRSMEFSSPDAVIKLEDLYVDLAINPSEIIVDNVIKILASPGSTNVAEFANGQILLRQFDVPEDAPLAGKKIFETTGVSELDSIMIVAIVRDGQLLLPGDSDEIRPGDKIYTLLDKEFLPFLLPMLNKSVDQIEKIVIFGATQIAINLAKQLEKTTRDICIIEPSRDKANEAADVLSSTVVHHGSGTDMDLFNDINISQTDFFMSLSEDDEDNILAALLAKKKGAKRALVIANDPEYLPILDSIGMDITVNPRLITINSILKHLRQSQVVSVFKLIEDAELIEIIVDAESKIAGKTIGALDFPKDARIGAILRNGEMEFPKSDFCIHPGDSVIVVALSKAVEKIDKLFGKRSRFFPFK